MRVRSILMGILASLFFAVTFVLNQRMSLSGGSWMWSASLRFLFMFPMLFVIVMIRGTFRSTMRQMRLNLGQWVWWSTVGFGAFYAPMCFAADFAPSWLVAASWQFTIIAGSLVVPLFREEFRTQDGGVAYIRKKLPIHGLLMSALIFVGILMMEMQQATMIPLKALWLGGVPVLVASFAYPLGNRKMMEVCNGRMGTIERVFGMTVASLPVWVTLSVVAWLTVGTPKVGQLEQTAVIAVSSGVIATILFFAATDMTKGNVRKLAAVEATQSAEVIFTLLLSMVLISWNWPPIASLLGMVLIMVGMVMHSLFGTTTETKAPED